MCFTPSTSNANGVATVRIKTRHYLSILFMFQVLDNDRVQAQRRVRDLGVHRACLFAAMG